MNENHAPMALSDEVKIEILVAFFLLRSYLVILGVPWRCLPCR